MKIRKIVVIKVQPHPIYFPPHAPPELKAAFFNLKQLYLEIFILSTGAQLRCQVLCAPKDLTPLAFFWHSWYKQSMHDLKSDIEQARLVGIIVPPSPTHEALLAAFAVKKAAGEKGFLLGNPGVTNDHWNMLFNEKLPPRDFALTVNTADIPIEELRYEPKGDALTVYFTSYRELDTQHFTFEEALPECDLLITVGFPNTETEQETLQRMYQNKTYKHISIARSGAATAKAGNLKLLSRMLFRSREELELNTLWSFISPDDFLKTEATPTDALALVPSMESLSGGPEFIVVLWQELGRDVTGLVHSRNEHALQQIAANLGVARSSTHVMLPYMGSFTEAERNVRKLLLSMGLGTMKS